MRSALDARGDNTRCDDQCMDGVRNTYCAWIQTACQDEVSTSARSDCLCGVTFRRGQRASRATIPQATRGMAQVP